MYATVEHTMSACSLVSVRLYLCVRLDIGCLCHRFGACFHFRRGSSIAGAHRPCADTATTNNVAEYCGLIYDLGVALNLGFGKPTRSPITGWSPIRSTKGPPQGDIDRGQILLTKFNSWLGAPVDEWQTPWRSGSSGISTSGIAARQTL